MNNAPEPIPVFFACNDNYAQHLAVTIASILDNSESEFSFYVLHSDIAPETQRLVKMQQSARPFRLHFIQIDKTTFRDFKLTIAHITIETYYRFAIQDIKPELDKAVYLDCDLIVRDDLARLWSIDLGENYAGGVRDFISNKDAVRQELYGDADYFNAGVLLLNLREIRKGFSFGRFLEIAESHRGRISYQDQDVLNLAFKSRFLYIDLKWNVTTLFYNRSRIPRDLRKQVLAAARNPSVVHYVGRDKPWVTPCGVAAHPFAADYFAYLSKTGFADRREAIFKRFRPVRRFFGYWLKHPLFFIKKII